MYNQTRSQFNNMVNVKPPHKGVMPKRGLKLSPKSTMVRMTKMKGAC